jgi:alpha-methylacyl-CoA racemase
MREQGTFSEVRGTNRLDTGAPYYDVYETADGKWVSIGTIEPKFFAELFERIDVDAAPFLPHDDRNKWPALRARLTEVFKTKTRDEWCDILEGTDACFAPVLPMSEAMVHPHLATRSTLVEYDGVDQPAPAPRFSRTPGAIQWPHRMPGADTEAVLLDWGFGADEVAALAEAGAIRQAGKASPPG